jgi:hypothetical protein
VVTLMPFFQFYLLDWLDKNNNCLHVDLNATKGYILGGKVKARAKL